MFKTEVHQLSGNGFRLYLLSHLQIQCTFAQLLQRNHFFCQRVCVGHHCHRLLFLQSAQYFGTKDFIGSILLSVLDGPSVGRWKEQDLCIAIDLHQIMIKIPCLLLVVEDKDTDCRILPDKSRGKKRRTRRMKPFEEYGMNLFFSDQSCQSRQIGMLGINLLKFCNTHCYANRCCKITK